MDMKYGLSHKEKRNVNLRYLITVCRGEYFDEGEREYQETGGNYIMRSFVFFE
jgi:hypothetical protein